MLCCACLVPLRVMPRAYLGIRQSNIAMIMAKVMRSPAGQIKPGNAADGQPLHGACRTSTRITRSQSALHQHTRCRPIRAAAPPGATLDISEAAPSATASTCTTSDQARLLSYCPNHLPLQVSGADATTVRHPGAAGAGRIGSTRAADEPSGCTAQQRSQRHHLLSQGVRGCASRWRSAARSQNSCHAVCKQHVTGLTIKGGE